MTIGHSMANESIKACTRHRNENDLVSGLFFFQFLAMAYMALPHTFSNIEWPIANVMVRSGFYLFHRGPPFDTSSLDLTLCALRKSRARRDVQLVIAMGLRWFWWFRLDLPPKKHETLKQDIEVTISILVVLLRASSKKARSPKIRNRSYDLDFGGSA